MIKIIAAIRRRLGMTHAEYLLYIEHVHGRMSRAKPLGLARYVQNHVIDAAFGATGDHAHLTVLPRDSVTELCFEDFAALRRTFADDYTRTVIGPDGVNFSEQSSALNLMTASSGEDPGIGEGRLKVLFFLKAAEGAGGQAFQAQWAAASARADHLQGAAVLGNVRDAPLPPPAAASERAGGGDDYFGSVGQIVYDGVQSLWFDEAAAPAAVRRWEAVFTRDSAGWLDRSRSFWLLAREVEILRI